MQRDFPNYDLPDSVTEEGWYTGDPPFETHEGARKRGLQAAKELKALAATLDRQHNMVLVIHHDFLCR